LQAGVAGVVGEDALEGEFGFAVGINGRVGMVFWDGHDDGLAVNGAGRRKNKLADFVARHGVQKESAAGHIVGVEDAGFGDGLGDERFAREVHDGVEAMLGEDGVKAPLIGEVEFDERGFSGDSRAMAFAEVVERDDFHASVEQDFRADASDVAGCSSDQDIHANVLLESKCAAQDGIPK
jgi:hypothetical protein